MPSTIGINPLFLKAVGVDVSSFAVPPDLVNTMMKAGIQHIELAAVGDRLVILVNGKPMPQLGFSEGSMQRALDLAAVFNVQNTDAIGKLLPWVTRLGLNVVLRFPQATRPRSPISKPGTAKALTISPITDPASLITKFEVTFDQAGQPGILGVTTQDLASLTGAAIGGLAPKHWPRCRPATSNTWKCGTSRTDDTCLPMESRCHAGLGQPIAGQHGRGLWPAPTAGGLQAACGRVLTDPGSGRRRDHVALPASRGRNGHPSPDARLGRALAAAHRSESSILTLHGGSKCVILS